MFDCKIFIQELSKKLTDKVYFSSSMLVKQGYYWAIIFGMNFGCSKTTAII